MFPIHHHLRSDTFLSKTDCVMQRDDEWNILILYFYCVYLFILLCSNCSKCIADILDEVDAGSKPGLFTNLCYIVEL